MQVIGDFIRGVLTTVKVTGASLLYRHPFRTSSEGLRSDWGNIGKDIDSVIGKITGYHDDRQ